MLTPTGREAASRHRSPPAADATPSNCWLLIRLTTTGWVYDKKVTDPDNGVYNCDPKNTITVQSYT